MGLCMNILFEGDVRKAGSDVRGWPSTLHCNRARITSKPGDMYS